MPRSECRPLSYVLQSSAAAFIPIILMTMAQLGYYLVLSLLRGYCSSWSSARLLSSPTSSLGWITKEVPLCSASVYMHNCMNELMFYYAFIMSIYFYCTSSAFESGSRHLRQGFRRRQWFNGTAPADPTKVTLIYILYLAGKGARNCKERGMPKMSYRHEDAEPNTSVAVVMSNGSTKIKPTAYFQGRGAEAPRN